ncbi:PREDICTED: DNA repair protein XRCC2 homolog isoform X3 [Nicotiana attenuata]|uniref:DNA repair protein XRCC2 homolog isoform X3 n=1 Tax=Nicotiana attenuata TaxID=49451 RepID=UPI000904F9BD|nr:PREDICTED: DNA repair protein XRCC2 homolog isoform X3 [Nicotiana attenuata]
MARETTYLANKEVSKTLTHAYTTSYTSLTCLKGFLTNIKPNAAINCILPKAWKGINYGGLERLVMFVDLDCRFDVLGLSQSLKQRIIKANGHDVVHKLNKVDDSLDVHSEYDQELFAVSMRRFLYIRCYDSSEFLATLKTMHFQLQKEKEAHGTGVYLLMIDSIGAFYWMDRASPSIPPGSINRKSLSLQSVSESVVQEIQRILLVHPMLVLTTKATSLQDKYTTREVRNIGQLSVEGTLDSKTIRSSASVQLYREYMPSVWQSFVSHRILVRPSDDSSKYQKQPIYLSEWLLPSLKISDKFTFNDDGAYIIS